MKDENKNQKVVFLGYGDTMQIPEEDLDVAQRYLRAVGLSLRLALEGKDIMSPGPREMYDMSYNLLDGYHHSISKDGRCSGKGLCGIAMTLVLAYYKWGKRGSKKTKKYILEAMRHLLAFAKVAKVNFFELDTVEAKYKKQKEELEAKEVM